MLKAGWRRTADSLRHKQDPAQVARARRVLNNLKREASVGRLKLYYLDECGFSPTLPTASTWTLPGQRKRIRYESPQGRRVNAMAAYWPDDVSPRLEVFTAERTWTPTTCWGSSGHCRGLGSHGWCWTTPVCTPATSFAGLVGGWLLRASNLYFLPPYSPELNEIEPVYRQVKYQDMPQRSYTSRSGLRAAVDAGFDMHRRKLMSKSEKKPRRAA